MREERAWSVGASGEETVATELARIARGSSWRFLHSVPVGTMGSDIDHVLIGPGGVFTINTKALRNAKIWIASNTFMVNGHRQPYLRNSRHEADRATKLLSAAVGRATRVHAVIAVVDPREITVREPPADVTVLTRRDLPRWARDLPPVLDAEAVEAVFNVARRSTTWR
ncbi:NERD domain-containing protein [Nocardioides sp. zg-536]|uniref:NERD domain-containing protein n=2 Tax=Nocardioides faecalis TaxID=2803858 RepID=A0A938YBN5_9ACTN|nr:nuclease-related domain-containing protein [Nocardioides faecalis]MBM9461678.1 NERD domain-containing protein [Nocardioides faecalis]MBS4754607.1 NERD domain-containing protein [Nocardioides faecalis]QVI59944.1 NERD domain-containing protein [Nocardioides faecalis]